MKIAIIGSKSNDSMEENLREAFCFAGHDSMIFDSADLIPGRKNSKFGRYLFTIDKLARTYSDRYDTHVFRELSCLVNDWNPDLVVCVYRFIHPCFVDAVKKTDRKVIHVNPDALTTFEFQQVFASQYDAWFTKDPYIVHFMRDNMHLNAFHYNEAFNPRYHKKPDCPKRECENEINIDVCTYGTIYPYRVNMLKQVIGAGIDVKVFGVMPHRFYNHEIDNAFQNKYIVGEEKSRIVYGSKIVFNQMHYAEIDGVNCRFMEVYGIGGFQLSDYKPILKDLLPIDPKLVSFNSIDEGIDKIKYYLIHSEERIEIASIINQYFMENYSYDKLCAYILDSIK